MLRLSLVPGKAAPNDRVEPQASDWSHPPWQEFAEEGHLQGCWRSVAGLLRRKRFSWGGVEGTRLQAGAPNQHGPSQKITLDCPDTNDLALQNSVGDAGSPYVSLEHTQ